MLSRALILALLAPSAAAAETAPPPPVGFRYTVQSDVESTSKSGVTSKNHSVYRREVVASDGVTIQSRAEATVSDSNGERTLSTTTTHRLFLLTSSESTVKPTPDQPAITTGYTLDCPSDELDRFYPRGAATQISVSCKITTRSPNGTVLGPLEVTAAFSDLGPAQDKTPAGAFDVRKILVRLDAAGGTTEITYHFAPALGISVMQDTKVTTSYGGVVTHYEVKEIGAGR
jgi:hypothetical protein